ncbi:NAD(P)-binding domain [Phytophthora cactorum]|nr:NAD(P)-binding domain [Phytophthora cactorum]
MTEQNFPEALKRSSVEVDAAFSGLGTNCKYDGSAKDFRKVDLDYVTKFAEMSEGGWRPVYGLFDTKGEVEDKLEHMKLQRTSIFRPGMLQRGDLLRRTEKMFGWMIPGGRLKQGLAHELPVLGSLPVIGRVQIKLLELSGKSECIESKEIHGIKVLGLSILSELAQKRLPKLH